mgnify:FL=1
MIDFDILDLELKSKNLCAIYCEEDENLRVFDYNKEYGAYLGYNVNSQPWKPHKHYDNHIST